MSNLVDALSAMAKIAAPPAKITTPEAVETLGLAMIMSSARVKAGAVVVSVLDRAQLVVDELEILGYHVVKS